MVFEYVTSAIFLGFVVAIPPGSVTVIACQRALQFGLKNSLYFSFGSVISDIFYIVLVYFGLSNIITDNPEYKIALWGICGTVLIIIGISSIISAWRDNGGENRKAVLTKRFSPTFISGIVVTLTNPMTIVGWLGIAGNFFLIWNTRMSETRGYLGITIFLFMFGAYLWFFPLVFVVSKIGKVVSSTLKKVLIAASGCILVIFGIVAFYFVVQQIRK